MPLRIFVGSVLLGAVALIQGCEDENCTLATCGDGVTLTMNTVDGTLPAGEYAFQFVVDGVPHTCEFRAPDDIPATVGTVTEVECSDEFA